MIIRKISFKNYIKYGIIVFISLAICVLLFVIYNNYKDDSSILSNKVKEIDALDIDNYISENESVLLYFGVEKDEYSRNIEEQMIEMIEEDNLDFVYVNMSRLKNKKNFLKSFSKKYSDSKIINDYPAFVYIKDNIIIDLIQKEDRHLEIEDVERFVEMNDIKGEKNA